MEVYVRRESVWIPTWENNQDNPPEEQIRWKHTFLRTDERKRYFYAKPMRVVQIRKAQGALERDAIEEAEEIAEDREIIQDLAGVARAIDRGIENLTLVYEDGEREEITTVEQLYAAPDAFPILRAELEAYVLTLSARGDLKNLQPPSSAT